MAPIVSSDGYSIVDIKPESLNGGTDETPMPTDIESRAAAIVGREPERAHAMYFKEVNKAPRPERRGRVVVKHDQRRAYYLALLSEIRMLVDYIVADTTQTIAEIHIKDPRSPSEEMTIGELKVSDSSSAFQTSLPVFLCNPMTQAPGFPPVKRIRRSPSINGDGVPGANPTW